MKELSIEDKAKRYDEVVERAKEKYAMFEGMKQGNVLEDVFPELKESEDENIRKWIYGIIENPGLPADKDAEKELVKMQPLALAWLEKQGQTFTKKDVDDAYLKGVCDTKQELEKQGEQKTTDKKGMNLVEEKMTPFQKKVFCIIDTAIEEEQGLKQVCDELLHLASNEIEQKP